MSALKNQRSSHRMVSKYHRHSFLRKRLSCLCPFHSVELPYNNIKFVSTARQKTPDSSSALEQNAGRSLLSDSYAHALLSSCPCPWNIFSSSSLVARRETEWTKLLAASQEPYRNIEILFPFRLTAAPVGVRWHQRNMAKHLKQERCLHFTPPAMFDCSLHVDFCAMKESPHSSSLLPTPQKCVGEEGIKRESNSAQREENR